ncbi:hypothetical protein AGMMS49942_14520 [Spirochaetia bacterium]|nr:hypothetical protein AGMMS49942_14520 [Spirochaetia bacterium]
MKQFNHGLIAGLAALLLAAIFFVGCESPTDGLPGPDGAKGAKGDPTTGNPGQDFTPPSFAPPEGTPVAATWTEAEYYLIAKGLSAVVYNGGATDGAPNRFIPAGKTVYVSTVALAGKITLANTAHLVVYGALTFNGGSIGGDNATNPENDGKVTVKSGSITTGLANQVVVKQIVLDGGDLVVGHATNAPQVKVGTGKITVNPGAALSVAAATGAGTLVGDVDVKGGTLLAPTGAATIFAGTKAIDGAVTGTSASTYSSAATAVTNALSPAEVTAAYNANFGIVASTGNAELVGTYDVPLNKVFVIAGTSTTTAAATTPGTILAFTGGGDVLVTKSYAVTGEGTSNYIATLSINGPTLYAGSVRVAASVSGTPGKLVVNNKSSGTDSVVATFTPGDLSLSNVGSGLVTAAVLDGLTITFKKGATALGISTAMLNNTVSTGRERIVFEENSIMGTTILGTGLPTAGQAVTSAQAGSYKPDSTTATWVKETP